MQARILGIAGFVPFRVGFAAVVWLAALARSRPALDARTERTLAPARREQVRADMRVRLKGVVTWLGDQDVSRPKRQRAQLECAQRLIRIRLSWRNCRCHLDKWTGWSLVIVTHWWTGVSEVTHQSGLQHAEPAA